MEIEFSNRYETSTFNLQVREGDECACIVCVPQSTCEVALWHVGVWRPGKPGGRSYGAEWNCHDLDQTFMTGPKLADEYAPKDLTPEQRALIRAAFAVFMDEHGDELKKLYPNAF